MLKPTFHLLQMDRWMACFICCCHQLPSLFLSLPWLPSSLETEVWLIGSSVKKWKLCTFFFSVWENFSWLLLAFCEVLLFIYFFFFQCFSKYLVITFSSWHSLSLSFWLESILAVPHVGSCRSHVPLEGVSSAGEAALLGIAQFCFRPSSILVWLL